MAEDSIMKVLSNQVECLPAVHGLIHTSYDKSDYRNGMRVIREFRENNSSFRFYRSHFTAHNIHFMTELGQTHQCFSLYDEYLRVLSF